MAPTTAAAVTGAPPSETLVDAMRRLLEARLGRPVQRIDTHISWVLLDGEHAWKLKKPLRLGFLDFAELATRRRFCEEELRLNRRLAPDLYLDVTPIGGSLSAPRLDGEGPAIEYAVRMKQFAAGALFSERLAAGTLEPRHLELLAERLAGFHESVPLAGQDSEYGSPDRIAADLEQLLAGLAERFGEPRIAWLRDWSRGECERLRPMFEQRKASGKVREGHGDLHLANLIVLDEAVTAFDCIEFDPGLRWIDVQNDIAFLVMDLSAHGRRDLAFRFLDAWLERSGDHEGLAVLRFYSVCRALVRALVTGIRRGQGAEGGSTASEACPDYLATARALAAGADPRLAITYGLSGSGKSWLAQRLLERSGAIRLRSDVERKRLFGLRALDDSAAQVPGGIYTRPATERTYARLLELAGRLLDAGYPTIVDAAFLRERERACFREAARDRRIPFTILHCRADPQVLRERVLARRGDPSEAGLEVLERQLAGHDRLDEAERRFTIEVDAAGPLDLDAIAAAWRRMAGTGSAGGS